MSKLMPWVFNVDSVEKMAEKQDAFSSGNGVEIVNNSLNVKVDGSTIGFNAQGALQSTLTGVFTYKGSVATYNDLPSTGNKTGDVYNVLDTGKNYAWSGTEWDDLAGVSAGAQWGNITGTLSSQTDLNTALENKYDKITDIEIIDEVVDTTTYRNINIYGGNTEDTIIGLGNSTDTNDTACLYIENDTTTEFVNFFITELNYGSDTTGDHVIAYEDIESKENKVTTLSASSTDTEYPTAKCVYDLIGNVETLLTNI